VNGFFERNINMLNFYTHKLGTTALALVCLGTFSSGSAYGMDDKIEEKDKIETNSPPSINLCLTDYQKEIVDNLFEDNQKYATLMFQEVVKLKDTPQQTFFLNQIFEKNKEFEEKKKLSGQNTLSSELKIEDNPIISISPQPFITNEIEEISSNNIIEKKPQDFYVQKDEKRDLWVGMEVVTKETQAFWQQRLGWDVFVLRGDQVKEEKKMKEEELNRRMFQEIYVTHNNSYPGTTQTDVNQILNDVIFGPNSSGFGNPHYNPDDYNNENLMYWRFPDLNLSNEEQEEVEKKVTKLSKIPQGEFESAWRGFAYNIRNPEKNMWVSYVCSKPVEGLLYKSFEVTSPDIRMAMTVKLGNVFYSPLGIYTSPLGLGEAQEKGTVEKYKNSSLLLHKNVAQFANKINPQINHMIVRPLKFMGSLLEKSGVLVSKEEAQFEYHIQDDKWPISGWSINGHSFDRESDNWFDFHPFLGGTSSLSKKEFPLAFASVKKLAELELK
jgi:hypothetical protein